MGFLAMFNFQLETLRGKHCQHPIAVMGVVDTFGPSLSFSSVGTRRYFFQCSVSFKQFNWKIVNYYNSRPRLTCGNCLSWGQTALASFLAYVLVLVHDEVEPRFSLKKYSWFVLVCVFLGFLRRQGAVSSTVSWVGKNGLKTCCLAHCL